MSFLGFINRFEPGKIIKMKIKVFTVSKTFFFSFCHIFKVYSCSPNNYSTNERLRVYYKLSDGVTETVQIASPENLIWPATEISDQKELKPQPVLYRPSDVEIMMYVTLVINNLICFKVR